MELNDLIMITIIILNIGTDRSEQTVQTQIRLLLMEQSDQGLLCLLFCLHLFEHITALLKSNCSNCRTIMVIISGVPIFRIFTVYWSEYGIHNRHDITDLLAIKSLY